MVEGIGMGGVKCLGGGGGEMDLSDHPSPQIRTPPPPTTLPYLDPSFFTVTICWGLIVSHTSNVLDVKAAETMEERESERVSDCAPEGTDE